MTEVLLILQRQGLELQEAKAYVALLDLGEDTAAKIAEKTGIGRVHMYQILAKLMDKGLVSFVIKNNVKYFIPAKPEVLLKELREKEQELQKILPELKARLELPVQDIKVEVYKGVEGFRTVLKDRIACGGDLYSFGVDEDMFKEKFGTIVEQFFREEKEKGLKEYILTSEKANFTYGEKHVEYRFIPDEFFDPTPTAIYKDKVLMVVWEPLTTILIHNKNLAEAYRKHFLLLWKVAKRKR